jgi:ubiquitin carboxyl-terminal hydrolase L5
LSILLNKDDQIDLGENLTEFKKTVAEFPSDMKGLAIGNNTTIKTVHNSFRRPESISVIEKAATSSDEVYHFIAYVPVNGQIYELDGLQKGPINHGPCTDQDWLDKVSPVIMQRIEKYSESEIRFNLLALIKNRKTAYTELVNELETQNARIDAKLSGNAMDVDSGAVGGALPDGADALHTLQAENAARIEDARSKIQDEEAKFKQWREENIRRRHNYIPFLFNLLQVLAQKQQLLPLLDKARQKHEEKKKEKPSGSK